MFIYWTTSEAAKLGGQRPKKKMTVAKRTGIKTRLGNYSIILIVIIIVAVVVFSIIGDGVVVGIVVISIVVSVVVSIVVNVVVTCKDVSLAGGY